MSQVSYLCKKIVKLQYEKRSLRNALKRAIQYWCDHDDNWDTDKDNECGRMEELLKRKESQ